MQLLFYLISTVILMIILFVALELVFRSKGLKPWIVNREKSVIKPEGMFYKVHPVLGFVHQPGEYSFYIKERFHFTAKHNEEGFRVTRPDHVVNNNSNGKPEIWIFGCSFTYGWLVNDRETFSWLLQEKLNEYSIENFGVSGYGSLHSYLLFKELIARRSVPRIVILAYGSLHDRRNTFTRARKKSYANIERISPFTVPCARINKDGNIFLKHDKIAYNGFPLSKQSALMNFIENKYNKYHDKRLKNTAVAEAVMSQFINECQEQNIIFIVAGIMDSPQTKKMLNFCENKGIPTVDISVNRNPDHPENSFYPYDDHPSPLAHRIYAEKLSQYLSYINQTDFVNNTQLSNQTGVSR